jgi:thiazole synthase
MNTAISAANDPILMSRAMKNAVISGRDAFLAGRMSKEVYRASPSSPIAGIIPAAKKNDKND